ncbi:MAG TPA: Xaa-Pro peptidase family protein [Thermoanaerobaculia bacterium]
MEVTRRNIVLGAGAAAAAALLPPDFAEAAATPPPLPPPLPPDVFRDRQSRLRAAAKAKGFDALFVTPSANLTYSANLSIFRSERLTALLLLTGGPAVLVTPSFEEANHRRSAVVDEVKTWKEDEDPMSVVASILGPQKTVGVEGSTAYSTVSALGARAGRVDDATGIFDEMRRVKSEQEQGLIAEAGRRTVAAIRATHKRIRAGMSEGDVERILEEEFVKQGVRGGGLVQFGPSSAFPHGAPAERRLAKGDPVLIDCGCRVHGYTSDVTRTVSFGPPSDELRKVYDIVDRAQVAGIQALKAGVSGEDVDRAARKVIEDAGYGQFFTHRLGHGLGLDGHEAPYLVHGNKTPLVIGNTETIEPGIYMPDKFGVRIEDDYAVRKDTPGSLSERTSELEIVYP